MPKLPDFIRPPTFEDSLAESIAEGFRELLSEKHLYQSVSINLDFIERVAASQHSHRPHSPLSGSGMRVSDYESIGRETLTRPWAPNLPANFVGDVNPTSLAGRAARRDIHFVMPTIKNFCPECDAVYPFNNVPELTRCDSARDSHLNQWFYVSYECQGCKGEPVRFIITRSATKLTMAGRSPIEHVSVPSVIPKASAQYFRNALLAYQSGQVLAGIFMLRVCV